MLVADVAVDADKSERYDRLERIRDPSHTHALTVEEFAELFRSSGLVNFCQSAYGVEIELEAQFQASFPRPGDEPKVKEMITKDIGIDHLGINARYAGAQVIYTVPISVYAGRKKS